MAGSKEKTMMRNTTMKMSVNPQESMDKFLQRLEKSVIDFIASGNKTKVGFGSTFLFPLGTSPRCGIRASDWFGVLEFRTWTRGELLASFPVDTLHGP